MARTASRTTLYSQNIQGNPLIADLLTFPGDVYFVGSTVSGATDGTAYGRTPDKPFATLAYAVGRITANQGDAILVLPGHAEVIIAADGLHLTKAGTTVMGLGQGLRRPTITYTTSISACVTADAANCTLDNLILDGKTGIDNLARCVKIRAADCVVRRCLFRLADATSQAQSGIDGITTACHRLLIEDNVFTGTSNAGTANAVGLAVACDGVVIRRNVMIGAYTGTNGGITNTSATTLTNLLIDSNVINNLTAGSTKAININTATTTGMIVNNRMQILSGTAPITGAAMSWLGNYYSATIGAAGTLV